ncbi:D-cysteine desulfhydrase family protein [Flavobacterium sp. Arc3]|uniref:D-cysteine desulfhydrase family protein n=1 Tax=Flavobacterium sp. Arc3 TaxID=3046686 RepID=UPI00352EA6BD
MIDNKFSLGFFPTPLQELSKLSKKYPDYKLFIKRDENTGLAFGGNKTRKLEYLIKQALDENCDTIITAGAQQSNHCRQTAAACAIAGLRCHLLLGGEKPDVYDGNLLLSSILGAEIHFTAENRKGEDGEILKTKIENEGRKCFVIPYGGSNFAGAMGFVTAVKELKEQLIEQKLKIDYIFFASSSGGMQAGLTLGKEVYQLDSELIPISIDKEELNGLSLEEAVLNRIEVGALKLNVNKKFNLSDIKLIRDYDKEGYGVVTTNEINAISELVKNEGVLLDPVYTARAFYGMLDFLNKKRIPTNTNILFWHTGGLPAIFKYANDLQ